MKKLLVLTMLSLFLLSTIASAYTFDNSIIRKKLYGHDNERVRRPQSSTSGVSIQTSGSSSGDGCITQWGWNGQEWVLRDLVNPFNRRIVVLGEDCGYAFDMVNKSYVDKPTEPGTKYTAFPLSIQWAQYRNRAMW